MRLIDCPTCGAHLFHLKRTRTVHHQEVESMELDIAGYHKSMPSVEYRTFSTAQWESRTKTGAGRAIHKADHVIGADDYHFSCPHCNHEVHPADFGWEVNPHSGNLYYLPDQMEETL